MKLQQYEYTSTPFTRLLAARALCFVFWAFQHAARLIGISNNATEHVGNPLYRLSKVEGQPGMLQLIPNRE